MIPGRVVEVLGAGAAGSHSYGSGYLIGAGLVLTARHVVSGVAAPTVRFGAARERSAAVASIVWEGVAAGCDVALLSVDTDGEGAAHLGEFFPAPEQAVPVRVCGFPLFRDALAPGSGRTYREPVTLQGWVRPGDNAKSGLMSIIDHSQPEHRGQAWRGISGAAVFADDLLVGVVTVAHSESSTLRFVPVTDLLGAACPQLADFIEPEVSRAVFRGKLADAGVVTAPYLVHRRADYLSTVTRLRARTAQLSGREIERERLERWARHGSPYALWTGPPWAGKTALAADFAAHRRPDVEVVSFFFSRAELRQTDAFWPAVADQLAALVNEQRPEDPQGSFDRLWEAACERVHASGRRLVLVIDGLDELDEVGGVIGRFPIVSRLPATPLPEARVLLFSRPNPDFAAVCPPDHPLRAGGRHEVIRLGPSPAAQQSRERARNDLWALLHEDNKAGEHVLGLLCAAGPLTIPEAVELLGREGLDMGAPTISAVIHRAESGRLLAPSDHLDLRWAYAHDSLREEIEHSVIAGTVARYREVVAGWGDGYAAQRWPPDTPVFLVYHYAQFLDRLGDRNRLMALLASEDRSRLLQGSVNGHQLAADEFAVCLAGLDDGAGVDLRVALVAGIRYDQTRRYVDSLPDDLVIAHAVAGDLGYAEYLARCQRYASHRLTTLTAVADLYGAHGKGGRCRDTATAALAAARLIDTAEGDSRARESAQTGNMLRAANELARQLSWPVSGTGPEGPDDPDSVIGSTGARLVTDLAALVQVTCRHGHHDLATTVYTELENRLAALPLGEHRDKALASAARAAVALGIPARAEHPSSRASDQDTPVGYAPMDLAFLETLDADSPENAARLAIERGDLVGAAELLAGARPQTSSLVDGYLGGFSRKIAALVRYAVETAQDRDALPRLLQVAMDAAVDFSRSQTTMEWGTLSLTGSPFPHETAGIALVDILEVAARAGRLAHAVELVSAGLNGEILVRNLSAAAIGAERAELTDTAWEIANQVRSAPESLYLRLELALRWAGTEHWARAVSLVSDIHAPAETAVVVRAAVRQAIERHFEDDATALLEWYAQNFSQDNPFFPGQWVACMAAAALGYATVGEWNPAAAALHATNDRMVQLLVFARLAAQARERAEHAVAWRFIRAARRRLRLLSTPAEVARGLATLAKAEGDHRRLRDAASLAHALPLESDKLYVIQSIVDASAELADYAVAETLLDVTTRAVARASDDEHNIEILCQLGRDACRLGTTRSRDIARAVGDALLRRDATADNSHLRYHRVLDLAEDATTAGDEELAGRLLTCARGWALLGGDFITSTADRLIEVGRCAVRQAAWQFAHHTALMVLAEDRGRAFAALANEALASSPVQARRWLLNSVTHGISPQLLAVACRLDPSLLDLALNEFTERL